MKRIQPHQLQVGVPLPVAAYDENHNLLLRKGAVLTNERQLHRLVERGLYIEDPATRTSPQQPQQPQREPVTLVEELERIRRELNSLLSQKPISPDGFEPRIIGLASRLQNACHRDPDCCLAALLLDHSSRYSVRHMVHVAVVSSLVGEGAGMDSSSLLSLMAAALTMNLSMLDLQDNLQALQKATLTDQQRSAIRDHPMRTVHMLEALGVADSLWLEMVLSHHEALDGSGYPRALQGSDITLGGQIIALADGYTARLERRADRDAKAPNQSLREVFLSRGKGTDPMLAAVLVKRVGIFPPGVMVELENGEIAIVSKRTDNANAPEVHAILSPERTLYSRPVRRGTERPPFTIRNTVPMESVRLRFNPLQFWIAGF